MTTIKNTSVSTGVFFISRLMTGQKYDENDTHLLFDKEMSSNARLRDVTEEVFARRLHTI